MVNNMEIYDKASPVPDDAKEPIKGGAYGAAGLIDINTQWRIERMTEIFGPCGIGWDFTPVNIWTENGTCFAHVTVSYKRDGEWSRPVHGYGGTKWHGKDDSDIIKSTMTDALGNALRHVGIGAQVWRGQFDSKYAVAEAEKAKKNNKQNSLEDRHEDSADYTPPPTEEPPQFAPAKPAQQPQTDPAQSGTVQMATAEQLRYIKDRAEDDQYMALMSRYGADLERLTYSMAQKAIDRINGGAA